MGGFVENNRRFMDFRSLESDSINVVAISCKIMYWWMMVMLKWKQMIAGMFWLIVFSLFWFFTWKKFFFNKAAPNGPTVLRVETSKNKTKNNNKNSIIRWIDDIVWGILDHIPTTSVRFIVRWERLIGLHLRILGVLVINLRWYKS